MNENSIENVTNLRKCTCRFELFSVVKSNLITKPKDTDAVVGGTAFLNCSTTLVSAEIHWFHYAVGDTKDRSFVYGYDQFYSRYLGRFQMEKNAATGSYNLIISSVTIADAGRFECQDDSGRGAKYSAQLTVLGIKHVIIIDGIYYPHPRVYLANERV